MSRFSATNAAWRDFAAGDWNYRLVEDDIRRHDTQNTGRIGGFAHDYALPDPDSVRQARFFLPLFSWARLRAKFPRPAASRLLLSRLLPYFLGSLPECSRSLWEQAPSLLGAPGKRGRKRRFKNIPYLNSVTLMGFVGADPEQRQTKGNGSKFTVFSLATQRSWKNADDEWASKVEWHRISVFRPRLVEFVAAKIKKGAHVLIGGSLVNVGRA